MVAGLPNVSEHVRIERRPILQFLTSLGSTTSTRSALLDLLASQRKGLQARTIR